jgi:hypothetical protein
MDKLEKKSLTIVSQTSGTATPNNTNSAPAELMSDKDNCLFSIANLLKGSTVNAKYFIQSDGPRKVMQELLTLIKEPNLSQEKMEIVELCVSSIKQLANTK